MTAAPGLDVSRETAERLAEYAALLRAWNPKINLVSRQTLTDLESRHFADSAQLLAVAPPDATTWADLGSGGGFPGLVIAILAAEQRPTLSVTLVESDQRKAVFLRTVAQRTGVPVTVLAERIESVPPLGTDVLSARALAPLTTLLDYADRHLAPSGTALFPKGANWRAEVDEALERWRFRCENLPSATSPDGAILRIGEIDRV
jgi:16S rRNA (guanine527-N7)-methyltransferase